MKKTIIILGIALTFAACSSNDKKSATDTTVTTTTTTTTTKSTSVTVPDTAGAGALLAKNDCFTCHRLDTKIIGPPYYDVAKKYTASQAVIDTLANKVIKGGSGNWGTIAMSPHAALSMDDAKKMVTYILSLKK